MEQSEPEIINPVVTQSEPNHRRLALEQHRSAIKECAWQQRKNNHDNALLGKFVDCS
ncbi:MAG: hypothetical protein ABJD13_10465 [Paracoccaceae bacterium]